MNPGDIPADQRWPLGQLRDNVFSSGLCRTHKLLMLALLHHMRQDQTFAWPSYDTIEQEATIHRGKIRNRLDELVEAGWLLEGKAPVLGPSGRRANCYWTPRLDVEPQVPEHCTSEAPQARHLRQGTARRSPSSVPPHGTRTPQDPEGRR